MKPKSWEDYLMRTVSVGCLLIGTGLGALAAIKQKNILFVIAVLLIVVGIIVNTIRVNKIKVQDGDKE